MAQITMTIAADSAGDLTETLIRLGDAVRPSPAYPTEADEAPQEVSDETQGTSGKDADAPKRTRRTKEQIAADAAKADPTPAPQSGTPAQTDAGGPSDLEKELLGEESATPVVDYATLAAAGTAHIAKHGADKTMAVLEQHGAGAKSFKQVPTELYGAVYAALQAELP